MWCIHKTDLKMYEDLMHSMGYEPVILHDHGDKVEVQFAPPALQMWVSVGKWHGSCY
jgi:hypothetical protein